MTFGAPKSGTTTTNSSGIASIVVLGADALLAALPATPIQLAHACALVGYQSVVPASWGDELIAAASLRALRHHGRLPAIQCSCPYVTQRLLAAGTDLRPFLVSLVAPPVVLARYLRAIQAPRKLRITYVGGCPGAADESIDARLTAEELLATFVDHHIVLEEQPDVFDSVLPPDRRRYRSLPGGLPTSEMLWSSDDGQGARSLVELYGDELPVELAQHLLAGKPVLIDVAPKLGCVCAGAGRDVDPIHARARVTELEPPRASHPVLDESVRTESALSLPAGPRHSIDIVSPDAVAASHADAVAPPNEPGRDNGAEARSMPNVDVETPPPIHVPVGGRRFSPSRGIPRQIGGGLPTARDADGRQLPRSYVARRRAPTRLAPKQPNDAEAPLESATEPPLNPESVATEVASETAAASNPEPIDPRSARPVLPDPGPSASRIASSTGSIIATGVDIVESVPPLRAPPIRPIEEQPDAMSRFAERPVALPVARLSDSRPREETPPHAAGERPVMQLLTLGLLIAMIVLVSAAVGVLVGRWMTQR